MKLHIIRPERDNKKSRKTSCGRNVSRYEQMAMFAYVEGELNIYDYKTKIPVNLKNICEVCFKVRIEG